jgi:hypothetical protein
VAGASVAGGADRQAITTERLGSIPAGHAQESAIVMGLESAAWVRIVSRTVEAHAGTVRAVPRPGGGLEITVSLPVDPDWDRSYRGEDSHQEVVMNRYLLSIYQPDGPPPGPEILEPIMRDLQALNEEMQAAGVWVFAAGLHPPETATVLKATQDEVLVTDGPFTEGKEHLGGITVIQADDLDAALGWARRLAKVLSPLSVEVRPSQS